MVLYQWATGSERTETGIPEQDRTSVQCLTSPWQAAWQVGDFFKEIMQNHLLAEKENHSKQMFTRPEKNALELFFYKISKHLSIEY